MRPLLWLLIPLFATGCTVVDPSPARGSHELYAFGCNGTTVCDIPADSCYLFTFSDVDGFTMCSRQCSADADCPDGRCVQLDGGGVCFRSCRQDDDCVWGACGDVPSPALEGAPTRRVCWFYPPPEVNCTAATSCDECTPLVGCGWCKTGQRCSSSNEHCDGFPETWAWETPECGP